MHAGVDPRQHAVRDQVIEALGIATGEAVRLTTRRGAATVAVEVSPTMQRGHVALPNGLGLVYGDVAAGVAPDELTATEGQDRSSAHRGTSTYRRASSG